MRTDAKGVVVLLALVLGLCLPAVARAVLAGENGRIVFISGREAGDGTARGYLLPVFDNSIGGGTVGTAFTPLGGQHRHPTWSPDRTKIAYANGTAGVFDIYVQDIAAGTAPVPITNTADSISADRPAWSPDGTRIAYERQPSMGSDDRDVVLQPANDLVPPFTTSTVAGTTTFEGKPAWSPDSATMYYHLGDPQTATNSNIVRKPVAGGVVALAVPDSGLSELQPSISPDGTKICYSISNNGFNQTADVLVAPLTNPPTGGLVVSKSADAADYNCTWSPDGQMIAYVSGQFSTGRLVMVRADNDSFQPIELAEDAGGNNFDGNPDWAPDGRPDCPDSSVTTAFETPVTFALTCTDTGPLYERTEPREIPFTQPGNGTLEFSAGEPFTYTPNAGFSGTDSFKLNSFDDYGFGGELGTVTITVQAPPGGTPTPTPTATATPTPTSTPEPQPAAPSCGGRTVTMMGTTGRNVLRGTRGADVIAGRGGRDTIRGRGGPDVICGGRGRDRLSGGRGRDRLVGGPGRDRCRGGRDRDTVAGCEAIRP